MTMNSFLPRLCAVVLLFQRIHTSASFVVTAPPTTAGNYIVGTSAIMPTSGTATIAVAPAAGPLFSASVSSSGRSNRRSGASSSSSSSSGEKDVSSQSRNKKKTSSSSSSSKSPSHPSQQQCNVVVDWDWQQVSQGVFEQNHNPVLLFDGVCNLCNGAVNQCLDWDTEGTLRFASMQSKVGQSLLLRAGKAPDDTDSMVLITPQKAFVGSDAVLGVAQQLQGLPVPVRWTAAACQQALPKPVVQSALQVVARHRHLFGVTEGPTCRLDLDGEYVDRFLED